MSSYKGLKIVRSSKSPSFHTYYLIYSTDDSPRGRHYLFPANSLEAAEEGIDYYLETGEIPGRDITRPEPASVNLEARERWEERTGLAGRRENPVQWHKARLARLQELDAPRVIIENEQRLLARAERRQA